MVCSKPGYGPCAYSIALRLRPPSQPGHAFVQNLRRGHYAITADLPTPERVRVGFDDLAVSL
jgi:hypothetical protein